MKRKAMLFILLLLLLLVHGVQAMSSTNYAMDWLVPLTGNGGGAASSAHYAANFTVGQTAINASTSANYGIGLGFWYGILPNYRVRLPLIIK
jgi:hypothetical protein